MNNKFKEIENKFYNKTRFHIEDFTELIKDECLKSKVTNQLYLCGYLQSIESGDKEISNNVKFESFIDHFLSLQRNVLTENYDKNLSLEANVYIWKQIFIQFLIGIITVE